MRLVLRTGRRSIRPLSMAIVSCGRERLARIEFLTHALSRFRSAMTLTQDDFRLNDLELSLDEIGIVARHHLLAAYSPDVRLVTFDFDTRNAGIILRQHEGNEGGRDHDQKEHCEDDGLANADNTPVIQEVKFCFLGCLSLC